MKYNLKLEIVLKDDWFEFQFYQESFQKIIKYTAVIVCFLKVIFSICSTERPPFPCGKTSNNTLDCLGFADDKAVFYEATVNMCTQPATVTLRVSQPETNFSYVGTFYKSVNPPVQIGVYNNELVFSFFP